MIDFTLTENDKAQLERVRAEALICRKYARYYEEQEGELPPDELPEAAEFYANAESLPAPGPNDSVPPVMIALRAMALFWGDYAVRLKRAPGGLDLSRRHPSGFQSLQTIIAEDNSRAAARLAFHAASHLLSVFDALRHQHLYTSFDPQVS